MNPILTCERIEELVPKVVDREALDWEKEAVDTHLASCDRCAALRADLISLGALVRRDVAAAVSQADFSGLWSAVAAGMDRVDAEHRKERARRLFFSWGAMSRWAATAAVAAAFAWAVLLPSGAMHDYGASNNRVEVSAVEGGANNTVMIYEQEDVTFIWVMDETYDERAL